MARQLLKGQRQRVPRTHTPSLRLANQPMCYHQEKDCAGVLNHWANSADWVLTWVTWLGNCYKGQRQRVPRTHTPSLRLANQPMCYHQEKDCAGVLNHWANSADWVLTWVTWLGNCYKGQRQRVPRTHTPSFLNWWYVLWLLVV